MAKSLKTLCILVFLTCVLYTCISAKLHLSNKYQEEVVTKLRGGEKNEHQQDAFLHAKLEDFKLILHRMEKNFTNQIEMLGKKVQGFMDDLSSAQQVQLINTVRTVVPQAHVEQSDWTCQGKSCYYLKYTQVLGTMNEAVDKCKAIGAYLLAIEDESENDFIFNIIYKGTQIPVPNSVNDRFIWLGLVKDKIWQHNEKEAFYTNWAPGQPDNQNSKYKKKPEGYENCTIMKSADGKWHDYPCTNKFAYLCEKDNE